MFAAHLLLILVLLLLSLELGLASICPSGVTFLRTNDPQVVTLSATNAVRGYLDCDSSHREQDLQLARFTPLQTGYYSFGVEGQFLGTGERAIAVRSGRCFQDGNATLFSCLYGPEASPALFYLTGNTEYTIFLGVNGEGSVLDGNTLSARLANTKAPTPFGHTLQPTHSVATCTDNAALSTSSYQTVLMDDAHVLTLNNFACVSPTSSQRIAQYTSFVPPVSGNYYVRVPYISMDLALEIRTACQDGFVQCNNDLRSPWSTGFNSIALNRGVTYIILLTAYSATSSMSGTRSELEIGLVGTPAGAPTTRVPAALRTYALTLDSCTDNPALLPHMGPQHVTMSADYQYETTLQCATNGRKPAVYVSFRAPVSGTYYVRTNNPNAQIAIEIRADGCSESMAVSLGCANNAMGERNAGFDSIALERGRTYVILLAAYWGTTMYNAVALSVLEVGLVRANEGELLGSSYQFGGLEYTLTQLVIMLAVPAALFGAAFLLIVCLCNGVVPDTSLSGVLAALANKIERLSLCVMLFSVLVLVTNWAVYWSSMASLLALFSLYRARRAYVDSSAPNFRDSHTIQQADSFRRNAHIGAELYGLNICAAGAQATLLLTSIEPMCYAQDSAMYATCQRALLLYPVFGFVCIAGMFLLTCFTLSLSANINAFAAIAKSSPAPAPAALTPGANPQTRVESSSNNAAAANDIPLAKVHGKFVAYDDVPVADVVY